MKVVATFHQPSSVVSSTKCKLTATQEFLVVGKTDRVEVFSCQPDGVRKECYLDIWGRVVSVKALPVSLGRDITLGASSRICWQTGDTSRILVLTDHPDPRLIVLQYSTDEEGKASLKSKDYIELHDRYARPAEFVTDVFVSPSGQVAVVSCYTGKLKFVQFKDKKRPDAFDASYVLYLVLVSCLSNTRTTASRSCTLPRLHSYTPKAIPLHSAFFILTINNSYNSSLETLTSPTTRSPQMLPRSFARPSSLHRYFPGETSHTSSSPCLHTLLPTPRTFTKMMRRTLGNIAAACSCLGGGRSCSASTRPASSSRSSRGSSGARRSGCQAATRSKC